MSRYTIEIDGIEYSVEILEDTGSEARVVVNDREIKVSVTAEAGPSGALAPLPAASPPQQPWTPPIRPPVAPRAASGELRAPMPSRVTEVLVSNGDRVEEGQLLLKIEAMKMENQVLSPIAGTVEKVCVSNGQEVAEGELLVKVAASR
jgi:biotin carboxyl carrier protein